MKKIIFFIAITIVLKNNLYSQTDMFWKMGQKSAIDFNGGGVGQPFLSDTTTIGMVYNNSSSICNNQGKLLFYSNGLAVFNTKNKIMNNGLDYNGGNFSTIAASGGALPLNNGIIVLPFIGDSTKFYTIYLNLDYLIEQKWYPSKLKYLVVDMTLDNGLGDVDVSHKEIPLIQNDTLERGNLLATRHGNGRDWWLIAKKFKTNKYFKFLIDSSGIHLHDTQQIGNEYLTDTIYYGQSCISQQGDKLAYNYCTYKQSNSLWTKSGRINFIDFDRCSGQLSNFQPYDLTNNTDTMAIYGSCFSPNGHYFYVNNNVTLKQMDMSASNILNSRITIQRWDGSFTPSASRFYSMKVGVDNRIYVTCYGGNEYTHVINNPDVWGGCNFVQKQIWYGGVSHYAGGAIPNTPNYKLGAASPMCSVGVEEVKSGVFKIYPNPANDIVQIKNTNYTSIYFYNILGALIYEQKIRPNETVEISVGYLSSGVYLLRATDATGKSYSTKFVKE